MQRSPPKLETITGYWIHAPRIFMIIQRKVSIDHFRLKFSVRLFGVISGHISLQMVRRWFDLNFKKYNRQESHSLFNNTFPNGFAWEVLKVFSPPPKVGFSWRHWGQFSGMRSFPVNMRVQIFQIWTQLLKRLPSLIMKMTGMTPSQELIMEILVMVKL